LDGDLAGLPGGHRRQHLTRQIGDDGACAPLAQTRLKPVRDGPEDPESQQDRQGHKQGPRGLRRRITDNSRDDVGEHNRRADRASGEHHPAAHRGEQIPPQYRGCPPQSRVQGRLSRRSVRAQDGRLARPMDGGIRSVEILCRKIQYVHAWYTTVSGAMNAVTQVMTFRA
jgi:hypothetical protein